MNLHWGGKSMADTLVTTLALSTVINANAKRMSGNRSISKQSLIMAQRRQTPPATAPSLTQQVAPAAQPSPAAPAPGTPAAEPGRNQGGMLGGLAASLSIGYLLSKFGLGVGLVSLLSNLTLVTLVTFVATWIIRKVRGSRPRGPTCTTDGPSLGGDREPYMSQPAAPVLQASAPTAVSLNTDNMSGLSAGAATAVQSWNLGDSATSVQAVSAQPAAAVPQQLWGVLADFDMQAFLRSIKVYFIRLQAAWDASNLDDIREFTTPEIFAETKMGLADCGISSSKTDMISVEIEVLGIETRAAEYLANMRFFGTIREEANASAQPSAEVQNLTKPTQGASGWVLAGIQQLQ